MKATSYHSRLIVWGVIVLTVLIQSQVFTQPIESDSTRQSIAGGFQFQLIGGLGLYYFCDSRTSSSFKVGFDASINHSNSSGNLKTLDGDIASQVSTSGNPEKASSSDQISASALYVYYIAEYAHTFLYCGLGPMASYSYEKGLDNWTSSSPGVSTFTNANENVSTVWGVGPVGMIGIRSRIIEHVSLSAEMSFSALHQWTSQSSSLTYTATYTAGGTYKTVHTSESTLKGWSISISSIRVGIILVL
jgi:hypothetical protein